MTFKATLTNNNIFKTAFESIAKIIDEVTLTADNEGIRLRALDRSHITFVSMDLDVDLFDEYQCDVPEKISIDATEFLQILKHGKTNDILRLSVDENNLIIIFDGDATRKFNIRFIDDEYETAVPPQIDHPINIKMPSDLLKDALNDMQLFSDKILFTIDQDYFKIHTQGTFGDGEVKYIHGENIQETCQAMFNTEKVSDIMRASKFSKEVTVSLGNDMPLKITFELITGDGRLTYLLAPRLEETD
ncbi:proliferating cell nuclear antigen (pcna) [Methanobrevibacter sp.]|uniref:proliferating cell nuclear antigen (pcna) n=1 Tax=Methanobrevibacter sp. TaxID=66852 RepID=UPI0025E8D453|nr:proliferating cell nuclear antigen (pcna) [Methanobrevibacter sp.]MBQ2832356.1 proliferating cell nuclear antigen (pcna) [Methanobrevibacter sp.]